jgi:hypothetical protein
LLDADADRADLELRLSYCLNTARVHPFDGQRRLKAQSGPRPKLRRRLNAMKRRMHRGNYLLYSITSRRAAGTIPAS